MDLGRARFEEAGLANLAGFSELENLSLRGTAASDTGIQSLHALKNLKRVSLLGTQVTDQALGQLREDLPNCAFVHATVALTGTETTSDGRILRFRLTNVGTQSVEMAAYHEDGAPAVYLQHRAPGG